MKKSSLLIALGLFAQSLAPCEAATPLLQYEFSQAGATQQSSGSESLDLTTLNYNNEAVNYVTASPIALPGGGIGNSLNLSAANVDAGLPSNHVAKGGAEVSLNDGNASFLRSDLESFTISGWFLNVQASTSAGAIQRFFSLRNGSGQAIIDFSFYNPPGTPTNELRLGLHGSEGSVLLKASVDLTVPVTDEAWYFVSVTYDAESGLVTFYRGVEGGTLQSETAWNTVDDEVNTLLTNASLLGIGNVGYQHQRRLVGHISDVHFYGEALSAAQVGALYAIPEPATALMIGAGAVLLCLRQRRSRA